MAEQESEWLNREIVEHAPDAIIMADRDGIIRLWNAGASAIFGYSAAEAIGASLDLIVPDQLRARHWEGFRKVMQTGVTRYGAELLAVPAIRRDEARISVEFSVTLLRNLAGEVVGVAAIMRDVTQRWAEQKQMRQRLADLEAQTAANETNAPAPPAKKFRYAIAFYRSR
jgi:PAS domain S-box-containing protein